MRALLGGHFTYPARSGGGRFVRIALGKELRT